MKPLQLHQTRLILAAFCAAVAFSISTPAAVAAARPRNPEVAADLQSYTSEPWVVIVPHLDEPFAEFEMDDNACRAYAQDKVGISLAARFEIAYSQCMFSRGYAVEGRSTPVAATTVVTTKRPPRAAFAAPATLVVRAR